MKKTVFQLIALFTIAAGSLSVSCKKNKTYDNHKLVIEQNLYIKDPLVNLELLPKLKKGYDINDLDLGTAKLTGKSGGEIYDFNTKAEIINVSGRDKFLIITCSLERPFEKKSMTIRLTIKNKKDQTLESKDIAIQWLEYIEGGKNFGRGLLFNGVYWAPVNCGTSIYEKGGLHYQWGRKDGHRPDQEPNIVKDTRTDNPEPGTFYAIELVPITWRATRDDKLWNAGSEDKPVKTKSDPCPKGWRVPTKKECEKVPAPGYTISLKGESNIIEISKGEEKIGFVAAGVLYEGSGKLWDVPGYGGYFSSKTNSEEIIWALSLQHNTSVKSASVTHSYIATGSSVRCVAE